VRGHARPLRPHRLLRHLDEHLLTLLQPLLDGPGVARDDRRHVGGFDVAFLGERRWQLLFARHVGDVKEGGLLETDVDERRLHPGQDADDLALVDVARDAALAAALDVQLHQCRVLEERYPRLPGDDVDQDVFGHGPG